MKSFRWRKIRASWRDTRLLLREFRQPLLWFLLIMLGSGAIFYWLGHLSGFLTGEYLEAVYFVLTLTFLQPMKDFPQEWYLQIFYFLMPVVGIGILAQGLAEFGVMFFNRRARGKEWEMAVASTLKKHVVLVGLGHLGFRVAKSLHDLNQDLAVIDIDANGYLVDSVRAWGVPVISGDATRAEVLDQAGVKQARAVILCTQDDSLNLRMALKARSIKPDIQVIVRIFDDDFAEELKSQFGFQALSATGMAAPVFAALAADVDMTPPLNLEGQPNSMAHIPIAVQSHLNGHAISKIEDCYKLSVVVLLRNSKQEFHPHGDTRLAPGDSIVVLGPPQQINQLVHENLAQ